MPKCDVILSKDWSEELFIDMLHEDFSCLLCTLLGICIQTSKDGFFIGSGGYQKVNFIFLNLALVFISKVTHMSH